jgi:prepilin-type N-terminal cleavage/methylation domain-containing protein
MYMTALWIREKSSVSQTKRQLQPSMPFDVGVVRLLYGQRRRTASRRSQRQVQGTQRGFSLVELLIVAAILTIVMAAVMGTLSLALQTTRNNSALVEANNNVRAALNIIKNDLDNVGRLPHFINQDPNPRLGGEPAVYVRGGFLQTRGFPVGLGSDAPNRVGNIHPILSDGTRLSSVTCDILSPIQAWTAATHDASPPGTFDDPSTAPLANQGYADLAGTSAANRYPNLRLYPGACDRTEVATVYDTGSHQLITLQPDPIPIALRVRVPDPANPNQEIVQRQIFQVEATHVARAQLEGSNLVLVPEIATSTNPDFPAGTPYNLQPSSVAPNRATPAFVNPDDRLLAPRLRPYLDTLLLTYEYVTGPANRPVITVLSVLGLVTRIDGNGRIILAGNDEAGINPADWRGIIQNNRRVTLTRMRLSHYFVGWEGGDSSPVLYCRQGGLLFPLAFDIENLRLRFTLVDEGLVRNNEPVQGIMFTTDDIGGPIDPPPGAPPGAVPRTPRSPLTTKAQVRMVEVTVYGRTGERERALIRADAAPPNPIPHPFNRGYFHVSERTTIGLRNLAGFR